jgi:hypothetical protein
MDPARVSKSYNEGGGSLRSDPPLRGRCWAALYRRFSASLNRYRLSKTSYSTFGHDHILTCPNVRCTHIPTYIHIHLDKDMEPVRGRKSYVVHSMRQDVAILCSKSNTNSDKACFGPAPGGRKITIYKDPVSPGQCPL